MCPDNLETEALKLNAKHFPLPCSLQKRVMARYADTTSSGDGDLAMDVEELLSYLRNMEYEQFSPLAGVLAQTEAIGDPALPTKEHTAILNWLGTAIQDWEQNFPLEEPLAAGLRRIKPLLAALAVSEPGFMTPGAHPLHQLLDTIQLHAIGWQPRLGRLGQALEEQVHDVVNAALAWFDSPATDLAAISAKMAATAAKAQARASKMRQRLIEAEHGRIRIAESKQQAALMINAALEEYSAPADLGEFLKGPWYDSAQLVLLKFGEDSLQWENMSRTTTKLLDFIQKPVTGEESDVGRSQNIFELVSELQTDLRRWLLSLQHDGEAVKDAAEMVDVFLSKVLRNQALELQSISPLALTGNNRVSPHREETPDLLREGQWFILDTDNSLSLRAMLVLRMDDDQQLLFVNQAGMKVLQRSLSEIVQQMAEGKMTPLDTGASFSRCLARSAGIETQEDLDEITGVAAERARLKEEQRRKSERERARLEREQAERERLELERQQREQEKVEQLRREREQAARLRKEREEAERLRREQVEQDRQGLERERVETKVLQQKWEDAALRHRERRDAEQQQARPDKATEAERLAKSTDLNLPRCTWLGFRDGDQAILATLAVYNRKQNYYIFVDRYGKKVRQLSGQELLLLISRGLADILEARPRFRDEVCRAQKQDDGE